MSVRILTDNFVGSPEEFYGLVIEEINARALPEIEFKWVEEAESDKKLFNKGDKAQALRVAFKTEWIVVFAYQIGACFLVTTRLTNRFHEGNKSTYLYDTLMFTFEKVVDRCARRALARHMEGRGITAPNYLAVNDSVQQVS
jgi:hypothetical protein